MNFRERFVHFLQKPLAKFGLWLYAYSKAGNTATTVFFFDGGQSALVIRRKHEPSKGLYAFPGGFLEVGEETLRQCAVREAAEETSIRCIAEQQYLLCDERSDPHRDVRGPIIDNGFYVMVPPDMKTKVLEQMRAGDDAEAVEIMSLSEIFSIGLAFDHIQLLENAMKAAGIKELGGSSEPQ